jgi:hypothetical protein
MRSTMGERNNDVVATKCGMLRPAVLKCKDGFVTGGNIISGPHLPFFASDDGVSALLATYYSSVNGTTKGIASSPSAALPPTSTIDGGRYARRDDCASRCLFFPLMLHASLSFTGPYPRKTPARRRRRSSGKTQRYFLFALLVRQVRDGMHLFCRYPSWLPEMAHGRRRFRRDTAQRARQKRAHPVCSPASLAASFAFLLGARVGMAGRNQPLDDGYKAREGGRQEAAEVSVSRWVEESGASAELPVIPPSRSRTATADGSQSPPP